MTNAFTKLGIVFLLVGSVAMIGPAFGVESLAAERGVQANVAADERNAYLGIDEVYDGTLVQNTPLLGINNPADVLELENNAGESFETVDVEVQRVENANNDVLKVANSDEFVAGLDPEESPQAVTLECSGWETASGTANVVIGIDAVGSAISVQEKSYTVSNVDFDCRESGGSAPPDDDPTPIENDSNLHLVGTPTANGGEVTFQIGNDGSAVTVTGISVPSTSADSAEEVNNNRFGDEAVVEIDGTTEGSLNQQLWDSIVIGSAKYDLDDQADIEQGDTATITLSQFREESSFFDFGDEVDMSDENVTIVLYFENKDPIEIDLDLQ